MRSNDTQVIVIGAGLAGVACARELNSQGIDTVILEARDRIGGRVHSTTLPDGTALDLGAQLIGPRQRRINKLAKEAGVQVVNLNHKGRSFREPTSALSIMDRLSIANLARRLQKEVKQTPTESPWLHPNAAHLDSISTAQWLDTQGSTVAAKAWHSMASRSFCLDANRISALEAFQHLSSMGGLLGLLTAETSILEDGAASLAHFLADKQNIKLNSAVQSISIVTDGVRVKTSQDALYAKQVVLAVPPQLGNSLLDESTALSLGYPAKPLMGSAVKTVLVYPIPWWRDNGFSGMGMSETGPVNELYNSTLPKSKHGVLIAISSGKTADKLPKDKQVRTAMIIEHVERLLKGNGQAPSFVDSVDWTSEPFSLGGFSSIRPIDSWMQASTNPINTQGPIHVAGTESATQWRSYMEGALQSAETAAARVLTAL